MKRITKILISVLCAVVFVLPVFFAGCGEEEKGIPEVDYVKDLKLDWTSTTKKQEVEVRLYIDGDTTHFDPVTDSTLTGYHDGDFSESQGIIKARYLAIDTPESTGDIEKWGKTASNFTREKLSSAETIVVESDDEQWNFDSTSSRRLMVWVWYKPKGETEFRNLNVEILQNGFALASSTANNRYGQIASAALEQARQLQLHVYAPASVKDENFYEGEAQAVDLKTLRFHMANYVQKSVRIQGVVTAVFDHSAYVEQYDEETKSYYGVAVYYGFKTGEIQNVLSVGNMVDVVGSITEFSGTYQISGVNANRIRPSKDDSRIIGTGTPAFKEVTAQDLISGTKEATFEVKGEDGAETEETLEIAYGEAVMSTSVTLKGLVVKSTYTTHNGGDNDGAISLTCEATNADGSKTTITVRTTVLTENGEIVTADRFKNKTINVKGIVDKYESEYGGSPYQIKVYRLDYIEIL